MFIQLKSLDVIGFTTWVTHLRKLLEKFSLIDLFDLNYVAANLYKNIKISVQDIFIIIFFHYYRMTNIQNLEHINYLNINWSMKTICGLIYQNIEWACVD